MRISDWSSDVCSSDLLAARVSLDGAERRPETGEPAADHDQVGLGVPDQRRARLRARGRVEPERAQHGRGQAIGSASCRERLWPYVEIAVVAAPLKKKTYHN